MIDEELQLLKESFEGKEISAVAFVRDYIEVQFLGQKLFVYGDFEINGSLGSFAKGNSKVCTRLVALIGERIEWVDRADEGYTFELSSKERLSVRRSKAIATEIMSAYSPELGFYEWY